MRQKKLKGLILLSVILCINTTPIVTYAAEKITSTQTTQQITEKVTSTQVTQQTTEKSTSAETQEAKVVIERNWLTKQVAAQLNKRVEDLTEQDFLSITKIDLKYEKIDDSIPKEIGLLKNLEYLDLNYTRIDGEIPESLADLQKLTHLDLGDNHLSELPDKIEQKIINGGYAYCDLEGNDFKLKKGWHYLKGKLCYIDKYGDKLTGTQTIDGQKYEFSEDGNLKIGWQNDNDKWYYYDQLVGMVKNAWKNISGKWYYFNENGEMQKGLQTIKGVKFFLNDSGAMVTGWQKIDDKYYYFSSTGGMQYGWINLDNNMYYLDANTGAMAAGEEKIINGKKYRFYSEGILIKNKWIDTYTYATPNGEVVNADSNYFHSNANYNLFKYMTDVNNQASVDSTAISLHDGNTSNNCVYFLSESLRRVGFGIPTSMCNTYQFENELKSLGFTYSYDLTQLKPGDIVFTNGYTHVYTFMGWDKDGYAYIVDNQKSSFGGQILHKRNVLQDTYMTDRATHFFYYTN